MSEDHLIIARVLTFDSSENHKYTTTQMQDQISVFINETMIEENAVFLDLKCVAWPNADLNGSARLVYTMLFEKKGGLAQ